MRRAPASFPRALHGPITRATPPSGVSTNVLDIIGQVPFHLLRDYVHVLRGQSTSQSDRGQIAVGEQTDWSDLPVAW
jgi:hypothetical protein